MRWNVKRMILTGCGLLLAAAVPPGRRGRSCRPCESRDFAPMAARLAVGARLRLENVQVAETGEARALVLERFAGVRGRCRITVHGDAGDRVLPAPANAYFRGTVEGSPGSRVFLARLEDGRFQGVVSEEGEIFLIGGDETPAKAPGGPPAMHRVDPALLKASRGETLQLRQRAAAGRPGNPAGPRLHGLRRAHRWRRPPAPRTPAGSPSRATSSSTSSSTTPPPPPPTSATWSASPRRSTPPSSAPPWSCSR